MAEASAAAAPPPLPRVSVVIPTYNRAADIGRCLDSLVDQTFRDFEVIVCDDGSTDGTADVVDGFKERLPMTYHWADNFGGPARPRNVGLRLALGEFVAFLDSDDWWLPEKLERSVQYLERGADLVYHDLYLVVSRHQRRFWRRSSGRQVVRPVFEDLLAGGNAVNNSSVVVRRALLQAIGGFSEARNLIAAEDYDAWLRLAQITDSFVKIGDVLGFYWVGDGNLSNPRRTVMTTEAIEERYASALIDLSRRRKFRWLSYVKARSYYLMGSSGQARDSLAAIDWTCAPLSIRVKSLWMRLVMGLQKP